LTRMKLFLTLATLVGFATAACPNSCSGHGTCNRYDACTCFKETALPPDWKTNKNLFKGTIEVEWTGADCSRRTCARGISWTQPSATDSKCAHQQERECSDQGICDRATGLCACFPGYTGSSCQRTACPDDCSGHGSCRSNKDFAYDWAVAKTEQILNQALKNQGFDRQFEQNYYASYESAWDSGMHYGCLCDKGYRGPSCALVECPSKVDPLDDKCGNPELTATVVTDFQLQFDAPYGNTGWEEAYTFKSGSSKEQGNMANSLYDRAFVEDGNGRKIYSCYGAMAGQDCSGRGICDYSSGTCKCFSGYAGTACESVESMA